MMWILVLGSILIGITMIYGKDSIMRVSALLAALFQILLYFCSKSFFSISLLIPLTLFLTPETIKRILPTVYSSNELVIPIKRDENISISKKEKVNTFEYVIH